MNYIRMDLEQGSDEWLEFRRTHLGASDTPIILGISPYYTPRQLWAQKQGFESVKTNFAMDQGHKHEEIARELFNKQYSMDVKPAVVKHVKRLYMSASLDGLSDDGLTAIEIKDVGEAAFFDDNIPEHHSAQMQKIMYVLDLPTMFYVKHFNGKIRVQRYFRNNVTIEKILTAEETFWHYFTSFDEPPITERDYVKKTDSEWNEDAKEWVQAYYLLKQAEAHEARFRKRLIEKAGDHSCIGGGVKLTKCTRKGTVQYDKIESLKSVDLTPYIKPSTEFWRVTCE